MSDKVSARSEKSKQEVVTVVDRDRPHAQEIAKLLAEHGYAPQVFHDAEPFLESIGAGGCACCIVDGGLKYQDRPMFEAVLGHRSCLSMLVFTQEPCVRCAVKAIQGGALTYLETPLDRETLIDHIRRGVRAYHACRKRRACLEELHHRFRLMTQRENEVLLRLVDGMSSEEIARELSLSRRTIESHRFNILRKSEANNAVTLVRSWLSYQHMRDRDRRVPEKI